jgi:hypothetical protein
VFVAYALSRGAQICDVTWVTWVGRDLHDGPVPHEGEVQGEEFIGNNLVVDLVRDGNVAVD